MREKEKKRKKEGRRAQRVSERDSTGTRQKKTDSDWA